jgi:hypothetical protein
VAWLHKNHCHPERSMVVRERTAMRSRRMTAVVRSYTGTIVFLAGLKNGIFTTFAVTF